VTFVDTSVWVASLRSADGAEAHALSTLLEQGRVALAAPVRVEILTGASNRDRQRLRRVLSALPLYFPTDADWSRIDSWVERAGAAGERFGFADLLIAAIAAGNQGAVWSLDADFARLARLGFISVYRP